MVIRDMSETKTGVFGAATDEPPHLCPRKQGVDSALGLEAVWDPFLASLLTLGKTGHRTRSQTKQQ